MKFGREGMKKLTILVMIKQVPDPSKNLRMTAEGSIDREKTPAVMNRNCKNAVEAALGIKDMHEAEITAVSMGPPNSQNSLREAISMGVDRGILLTDRRLAGSDTWSTAYALGKACERFVDEFSPFDIIFAGMQTTDGDTAHVGPQLAERLKIPVIAFCEAVELKKDGSLLVRRILEGGNELLRVKKLPILLTITGTENRPREPTLKGLIKAKRAEIISWNIDDVNAKVEKIGLAGSPTIVYRVKKVEYTRPPCKIIKGQPDSAVTELFTKMKTDDKIGVWL